MLINDQNEMSKGRVVKNNALLVIIMVIFTAVLSACYDAPTETPAPLGKLRLSMLVSNSATDASLKPQAKASANFNGFTNSSIASGPPVEFQLVVREMTLGGVNGVPRVIFQDDIGKTLKIIGSRIDMSDLFTNYQCIDNNSKVYELQDGESCDCGFDENNEPLGMTTATDGTQSCPDMENVANTGSAGATAGKVASLPIDTGEYSELSITYKRVAKIKGCVTGNYGVENGILPISGVHTYCTQADKAIIRATGGGENIDFEDKTAELMDLDLVSGGNSNFPEGENENYTLKFPIKNNINITKDGDADLTLLIDVNRMLRFYNQNISADNNESGNGAVLDQSFFFTSIFRDSQFVFVGQPGEIYGYQLETDACTNVADEDIPVDYVCPEDSAFTVAAWLTLVTDADGIPLLASFMPDDDNTLTVIKGANITQLSENLYGPDPSYFTENEDGTYNARYTLGENDEGVFNNIDLSVPVNSLLPNITFRGLQQSYGTVFMKRRL